MTVETLESFLSIEELTVKLKWFESDDIESVKNFNDAISASQKELSDEEIHDFDFTEKTDLIDLLDSEIVNGVLKTKLRRGDCKITEDNSIECFDLDLFVGSSDEITKLYNILQVDIISRLSNLPDESKPYSILNAALTISYHKAAFRTLLNLMKLIFTAISIVVFCKFNR